MASMDSLGKPFERTEFLFIDALGGQLYLTEIIMKYDHPLLFACQNEAGQLFLFNEIKDEHDRLEWGVISVDSESLSKFMLGKTSFRELYITHGDNFLVIGTYGSGDSVDVFVDNDKEASETYKEMLEFYDDDRKLPLLI